MAEWISERFPWRILADEEFWVRVLARRATTKKPCEEGLLFNRVQLGFKLTLKHALMLPFLRSEKGSCEVKTASRHAAGVPRRNHECAPFGVGIVFPLPF